MNLRREHEYLIRSRRAPSGFTIIEVMAALSILAFGILAIASMQAASLGGTNLAGSTTEGTTSAMDRMEQLLARSYSDTNLSTGSHGPVTQGRYTLTWLVTVNQPLTSTKTVVVTATWNEKGVPKTSSLTYVKMDVI
jgi:prepilin-type N-terminal cleavage/methylation domain-containing protein